MFTDSTRPAAVMTGCRQAGKPVTRLVCYERPEVPRKPGALKGKIKIVTA